MKLSDYPRPLNDTGRGVHWSASPKDWGEDKWAFWKDVLIRTNVRWVKVLHADSSDLSALPLCKRLVDIGIMPIVRIYRNKPNPDPIGGEVIRDIKKFVDIGVYYFETNNEPDNEREWRIPKPDDWLDIVVRNSIEDWRTITKAGGIYVFPAFSFGGDPNQNVPLMLVEWGHGYMFERMAWAIHNYSGARPVLYPEDPVTRLGQSVSKEQYDQEGEWQWVWEISREAVNENRRKQANPDASIFTDPTCFRAFEWLNHKIEEAVGHSIPILGTECGENIHSGFDKDLRWPYSTPQKASQMTYEQFKYVEQNAPHYFCHCVWLIAVQRIGHIATDYEAQGPWFGDWYNNKFGLKGELPLVQMLKDDPGQFKANGPMPIQWPYYKGPDLSGRDFDDELKYIEPMSLLKPVINPSGAYWRLQEARWEKKGRGVAFIRCYDSDGIPMEGQDILSEWEGGGSVNAKTKGIIDNYYGDVAIPVISQLSVMDDIPSDKLIDVWQGTVWLTFVKGERAMAFDVQKKLEEILNSPEVVLPDPKYGVDIELGLPELPGIYWKVRGVYHLTGSENGGNHNLFLDVVDQNGQRIMRHTVMWNWAGNAGPLPNPVIIDKPPNEAGGNIAIWGNMEWIEAWIEGNSDRVYGIRSSHPDEESGNNWGHHSFYAVFQKVIITEEEPPIEPPEPPVPGHADATETLLGVYDKLQEAKQLIENWKNG